MMHFKPSRQLSHIEAAPLTLIMLTGSLNSNPTNQSISVVEEKKGVKLFIMCSLLPMALRFKDNQTTQAVYA